MPRGDRTGPVGAGPITGRGAGYCAGYPMPGYANPMPGRFSGRWPVGRRGSGYGRGRRRRHWYYATGLPRWERFGPAPDWAPPTREQQTEALKAQAEWLTSELDAINQRLGELEKPE
jgi:hypothetical protein